MKICPKCARSFADGFTYCPKDATQLRKYDLRANLLARDELQFLLEPEPFLRRLRHEISAAATDFLQNPRAFMRGLLRGEGTSRRRRNLLNAGFATGVIAYAGIGFVTVLIGFYTGPFSSKKVTAVKENPETRDEILYIMPVTKEPYQSEKAAEKSNGHLGGILRERKRSQGGGGQEGPRAARKGAMPRADLARQLNPPDLSPPKLNPSLVVPETVMVDPKFFRKTDDMIGLLNGIPNASSLGNKKGAGIGPGDGPGYNTGEGGNIGDGKPSIGGDRITGTGDSEPVRMTSKLKPRILYKEKAMYTEPARQERIQGTVVLLVTFGADARIHDIHTVRGLPAGLTEKAIEAAQRIRFQPATQNGVPISVRGHIEFNFALY
jgi:TonB family protein